MVDAWKDPVLQAMWDAKTPAWPVKPEVFAHAELVRDTPVHERGDSAVAAIKIYPAGTKVICTMVSRFGDVGIRARFVDERRNGYDIRVDTSDLKNIVEFKKAAD